MNNLSWMLYVADVVGDLEACMCIVGFVSLVGSAISTGLTYAEDIEEARPWIRRLLVLAFALFLVVCITPSKDTIYAITASEYGEEALKSSTATKAQKALDAWLDKQIGDEQPEKQQ